MTKELLLYLLNVLLVVLNDMDSCGDGFKRCVRQNRYVYDCTVYKLTNHLLYKLESVNIVPKLDTGELRTNR